MTTTPAGVAPWVRTASIADYGGDATKADYLNVGVVNPKTDVSAAQYLRLTNDLAAVIRTAPLCTISWTGRESTSENPLVKSVTGMIWNWSSAAGVDGATLPAGYPTVTFRAGSCGPRITFASTYTDSFGVSGAISVRCARGCANEATDKDCNTQVISSLIVDVFMFDTSSGALTQDLSGTVTIW